MHCLRMRKNTSGFMGVRITPYLIVDYIRGLFVIVRFIAWVWAVVQSVYQASSFFWEGPGYEARLRLALISIYDVSMCGIYKRGYTRIV